MLLKVQTLPWWHARPNTIQYTNCDNHSHHLGQATPRNWNCIQNTWQTFLYCPSQAQNQDICEFSHQVLIHRWQQSCKSLQQCCRIPPATDQVCLQPHIHRTCSYHRLQLDRRYPRSHLHSSVSDPNASCITNLNNILMASEKLMSGCWMKQKQQGLEPSSSLRRGGHIVQMKDKCLVK